MTLEEKEKSVIQQGAYIVIKSHVKKKKKCKHTPPTLTGSVATLPVRATASNSEIKTPKQNSTDLASVRQTNTLILIAEKSIFSLL